LSDPLSHPSGSSTSRLEIEIDARAQLASASPENIQFRAVFIQFLKNGGFALSESSSNLGLTRGTVESLKFEIINSLYFFGGEQPHPISPQGF
jgi:hypothetical protein